MKAKSILPLVACSVALGGCGPSDSAPSDELSDVVRWTRFIDLEENKDVINVTPTVTLDPAGGFLVADQREGQLRRYAADGRLLWHAGRKGSGPGEFRSLGRALRLASGEILAMDWNGRATVYDRAGGEVLRTFTTPFGNVEDFAHVGDSLLLISALARESGILGPRLHLWDPISNEVRLSFFEPMRTVVDTPAASVVTWSNVAVRGDTVAAVFALGDTVHLFTTAGTPVGSVPISFTAFRRMGSRKSRPTSDPAKRARWLSSFDIVSALHWLPDGRFVIIYQTTLPEAALTRRSHLFVMDRMGRALHEAPDVPRLLTVDERNGTLYFVAENHATPNRWAVAALRGR